jgi:hypothetical protein
MLPRKVGATFSVKDFHAGCDYISVPEKRTNEINDQSQQSRFMKSSHAFSLSLRSRSSPPPSPVMLKRGKFSHPSLASPPQPLEFRCSSTPSPIQTIAAFSSPPLPTQHRQPFTARLQTLDSIRSSQTTKPDFCTTARTCVAPLLCRFATRRRAGDETERRCRTVRCLRQRLASDECHGRHGLGGYTYLANPRLGHQIMFKQSTTTRSCLVTVPPRVPFSAPSRKTSQTRKA